jgi:lipopolysaccharide heptosyltransferase II
MRARLRAPLLRAAAWATRPWVQPRARSQGEAPRRILLVRPDHLGDVLFLTPAIRTLRQASPDAHLACMVGPWSVQVLANNPHLNEILSCPFPGFTRRPKKHLLEPYLVLRNQARQLRSTPFDAASVMRFDHWWGAMLAYFGSIPRRTGYDLPTVEPFLTQRVPYQRMRHEVEQNMQLVSALVDRSPGEPGPLEFHPQPGAFESAEALFRDAGNAGDLICVHPGAGAPVKLWCPERFAQVADALAGSYGLQVVITGSSTERQLAQDIAEQMTAHPLVLAGRTSLDELAVIMSRSRLVIGVDSGPLHLAVSQGTPTIHLFGPTDHRLFGPWGDPSKHVVITADMSCSPCNRLDWPAHELEAHPCVRLIPVSAVLQAADLLLTRDSHLAETDGIIARDTEPGGTHVE